MSYLRLFRSSTAGREGPQKKEIPTDNWHSDSSGYTFFMQRMGPPDADSRPYSSHANPSAVSQLGNGTITYTDDSNSNVTEVGTTTFYTHDFDNRLTQSNIWNGAGTTTTTCAYDPFGNRISQTASTTTTLCPSRYYSITTTTTGTSTVATSTEYLYSGSSLLATVDQKLVNGTATGTPITRYNHPDNLGSTNVTSDASGNLAQWLDYAPVWERHREREHGNDHGGTQQQNQLVADLRRLDSYAMTNGHHLLARNTNDAVMLDRAGHY
jgi:hypothetical protein